MPTGGITVTVCVAIAGPLQPAALAVIVEVPFHAASHVTKPVFASMVLAPDGDKVYVIPVVVVAVAL
jgi:hypothetical protein